jgi:polyisoprenoid-binding protein YceI
MFKTTLRIVLFLILSINPPQQVVASEYVIDTVGGHAFINFRISHM